MRIKDGYISYELARNGCATESRKQPIYPGFALVADTAEFRWWSSFVLDSVV
jgi:hypothetical protein